MIGPGPRDGRFEVLIEIPAVPQPGELIGRGDPGEFEELPDQCSLDLQERHDLPAGLPQILRELGRPLGDRQALLEGTRLGESRPTGPHHPSQSSGHCGATLSPAG